MKYLLKTVTGVIFCLLCLSCATSYEGKGDRAYEESKNAQGNIKRKLEKEAYIYYQNALKAHPNKINSKLRNRFIEMTLNRAEMVLIEGSSEMDAIPLFIADVDNYLNQDVEQNLRQRYARFLMTLADSSLAKNKLYEGLKKLDKAIEVAADKAPYQTKKQDIIDNFAKHNYEAAELEYINGKTNKDTEALIRAEFLAKVALLHNKDYPEAEKLLSQIRKENRSVYSAYEAVVTDKPDTLLFDKVNKYDILLAVPAANEGRNALLKVEMYNYSYNPLRLYTKNFYIVDANGKKYPALSSSKIDKEILDQKHETKMVLRFKKGSAKIKKLVYETDNGEHYTEKHFF